MPQDPKQPKTTTASPSPGFLDRVKSAFATDSFTPEMQAGIDIARKEMPDMAPVKPYGWFSRLTLPGVLGYASRGNTIYLNPATNVGQSPQDIADTLTHEQSHVNDRKNMGFFARLVDTFNPSDAKLPYSQRPTEMAAYQAEKERRARMGRPQVPIPSFSHPNDFYTPSDVNLPYERKK